MEKFYFHHGTYYWNKESEENGRREEVKGEILAPSWQEIKPVEKTKKIVVLSLSFLQMRHFILAH